MNRCAASHTRRLALSSVVVGAFLLTGCHSQKRIAVPSATLPPATTTASPALKAGDQVRVTLQNGDVARFVLAEVQADALLGNNGRRILFRDMTQIEVRHLSRTKTSVLVAVLTFWLILVGALAAGGGFIPAGTI
jgi:hypothetical protein